jgi:predicted transglutaminase-like cysteine proteinase
MDQGKNGKRTSRWYRRFSSTFARQEGSLRKQGWTSKGKLEWNKGKEEHEW